MVYIHPVLDRTPHEAPRYPVVIVRLSLLLPRAPESMEQRKNRAKTRELCAVTKENHILGRAGLAHPPLPRRLPHPSSGGAIAIKHPTLVSLKMVRTASVALSSPSISLADGALGCSRPHTFQIPFHILLLRSPGPALGHQVMPGLSLAAVAPAAFACLDPMDLLAKVRSNRSISRQRR